jgi:hypothetical protein
MNRNSLEDREVTDLLPCLTIDKILIFFVVNIEASFGDSGLSVAIDTSGSILASASLQSRLMCDSM